MCTRVTYPGICPGVSHTAAPSFFRPVAREGIGHAADDTAALAVLMLQQHGSHSVCTTQIAMLQIYSKQEWHSGMERNGWL